MNLDLGLLHTGIMVQKGLEKKINLIQRLRFKGKLFNFQSQLLKMRLDSKIILS